MKSLPILLSALFLGMLVFSGCVSSSSSSDSSVMEGDSMMKDPSPGTTLADEYVGGTGDGTNDISAEEMQDLQDDLDALSTEVAVAAESDI